MHIQDYNALYLLWLLPVIGWLLFRSYRKRLATARHFADQAMVARLMPQLGGPRPWVKGSFLLLAFGCLFFAAARPRWGEYYEQVTARGVDLFVLLDVSRSMLSQDVAPNRLERAKSDIRDLLKKLVNDRAGLVVFAGKPVVKVPLTTDHGFFLNVLAETDVDSAPRGGTLIGDGIRKCLEAFEQQADRDQVVVLITDGEDHDSFPLKAAEQAAQRGVTIITVGLGDTEEGARIPQPAGDFVTYQNQVVWSRMDERLLREIALRTKAGAYVPARTHAYDLGQLYENQLAGLKRGDIREDKRKRFRERFQIFVALGLVCLAANMLIPSYSKSTRSNTGAI